MPADPRYPTVVFPPGYSGSDADLENEDWPKRTWDLPTDKAEFQAFLRRCAKVTRRSVRTEVAEFKRLPIYRWHKDHLPLDEWLRELEDEDLEGEPMMTPEVSRFVRDVMLRGRSRVDSSGSAEAALDRLEMWWRTEDRMRAEGQRARTVADLPQWLLDLAAQLGIEG